MTDQEFEALSIGDRVVFSHFAGKTGWNLDNSSDYAWIYPGYIGTIKKIGETNSIVKFDKVDFNIKVYRFYLSPVNQESHQPKNVSNNGSDALKLINNYRKESYQKPLDSTDWTNDDLITEAKRLGVWNEL